MKTQTVVHNGFHGRTQLEFRPIAEVDHPLSGEPCWEVSYRTARRLNAAICPSADCQCGERIAERVPWTLSGSSYPDEASGYIPVRDGEYRGHYPQS